MPLTATNIVAGLTAFAFLFAGLIGLGGRVALYWGVIPARLTGLVDLPGAVPAMLTPLSSTLVHGGWLHLVFNLIMLLWCGTAVERALGRGALVLLYVIGAYAAAAAQWAVDPASLVPMVGASGAISAVIGAFALSFGEQKRIVQSRSLNRALNSLWLLAAWVVLQLMIGWAAGGTGVMLATAAHIGGFLAGLLLQRPLLLWRYRGA